MKVTLNMPTSSTAPTEALSPASPPVPDDRPFAVPFRTRHASYAYDVNTNRILKISSTVFDALRRLQISGWPSDLTEAAKGDEGLRMVLALRKQGLLLGQGLRVLPLRHHHACMKHAIMTSLSQLTLEITELCNLRCRYCIYGAGYADQRPHGTRSMDMTTARRAIRWFYEHNSASPFISIGFYGGEPLAAFQLIQEVADGALAYKRGVETHFHMTTNGTLLTPDKFQFLIEHDFALLVSLDGPQPLHDRYRRNVAGSGTFATIMANLAALRTHAPSYYSKKVGFSCVRPPANSMREVFRFFTTHPLVRNQNVQLSGVSDGCPDVLACLMSDVEDWEDLRRAQQQLRHEYLRRVVARRTRGAAWRFLQSVFGKPFVTFHRRQLCAGPGTSNWINGMCIPASRKLFVACDGSLYTCERVGRSHPIGHVDTGVDVARVFSYLHQHARFHQAQCLRCWAARSCGACQSSIGGRGGIDGPRADAFCSNERAGLMELMLTYVTVLEADPHAWDFIEDISVS